MNGRVIDTRPIEQARRRYRRAHAIVLEEEAQRRPKALNEGELQPALPMVPEPMPESLPELAEVPPPSRYVVQTVTRKVPAVYEHAPLAGRVYYAVTRPIRLFVYFFFLDRRDY